MISNPFSKAGLVLLCAVLYGQGAQISGYVTSFESGESLTGANVFLKGSPFGAASNGDGYYLISEVPPGSYELVVSYLGYRTYTAPVSLNPREQRWIDIELRMAPVELSEVEVSGERLERRINLQISRTTLNVRQLNTVPALGEGDLFRSLQGLPGVLTETEFSTGLVIRGGNSDQNLILLDGITVYNPSHVGGLFSNFILDAIKEADLLKGGFNAEYGGRLSAVLNVRSREGNRKRFDGKASLSLLAVQATLEGPVGKGAWLFSARRTYFDQVFKGTEIYFPYYFYDLQGHVFQDLSPQDRLSVSWYAGQDNLFWEEFGLEGSWGNRTVSVNYRKLFHSRLVSNWMVAKSRFDILFGLGGSSGINETDYIDDLTLRSDWTYFISRNSQLRFGLELKDLDFVYSSSFLDSALFETRQSPLEGAGYLKLKTWPTPRLMLEPGLRLNYYQEHPRKWYLDPRLGIKYLLTPDRYLNLSFGVYHQFMETIQDDYNPKVIDAWFAVDPSVDPAAAVQYVAGYEEYFRRTYHLQVEIYYKTMQNLLTFVDPRAAVDEMVPDETLDDLVDLGDGYAYGGEFFLHREIGRLNGWIAYSYSVARKRFQGQEYFTNWDRRHALNLVGNYQLSKKWSFNLKWTYQSGQPFTPILGYYVENLPATPQPTYRTIPGGRNSARYPVYHRLDLGAVRHFRRGSTQIDLFLQIVNTYWRKNVFRYFHSFGSTSNGIDDDGDDRIDEDDEGLPRRVRINGLPIIPTIGVAVDF